jgi:hypothetical protein
VTYLIQPQGNHLLPARRGQHCLPSSLPEPAIVAQNSEFSCKADHYREEEKVTNDEETK